MISIASTGLPLAVFAVVRCDPKNNAVGGLGSVLAVITGLVIANAGAVPVIGLRGFWGAVVLRIIELGLVAAAARGAGGGTAWRRCAGGSVQGLCRDAASDEWAAVGRPHWTRLISIGVPASLTPCGAERGGSL
jgi:hypothetical protein